MGRQLSSLLSQSQPADIPRASYRASCPRRERAASAPFSHLALWLDHLPAERSAEITPGKVGSQISCTSGDPLDRVESLRLALRTQNPLTLLIPLIRMNDLN